MCLQIAFLHQKDEVVNGTVISLIIRNATTLQELENFRREFVLIIVDDGKQWLKYLLKTL